MSQTSLILKHEQLADGEHLGNHWNLALRRLSHLEVCESKKKPPFRMMPAGDREKRQKAIELI